MPNQRLLVLVALLVGCAHPQVATAPSPVVLAWDDCVRHYYVRDPVVLSAATTDLVAGNVARLSVRATDTASAAPVALSPSQVHVSLDSAGATSVAVNAMERNGIVVLEALPARTYFVRTFVLGYQDVLSKVRLRAGTANELRVRLQQQPVC